MSSGRLHELASLFLERVSEREFDAALLALLVHNGFYDLHFTHGAFEFGKDVIAKKADQKTGAVSQYAIQSKGGDIGLSEWRGIRPQMLEAASNTLAHPNFDPNLPRIAVLATTGRLKGGAILEAQETKRNVAAGFDVEVQFWDNETFTDWLTLDPTLSLHNQSSSFYDVLHSVQRGTITEPELEMYTRNWLPNPPEANDLHSATIELCILSEELRATGRVDLAALTSLHLLRGAWAHAEGGARPELGETAIGLFLEHAQNILKATQPLLDDPLSLARQAASTMGLLTYPVMTLRISEILALATLAVDLEPSLGDGWDVLPHEAVATLASSHPGTARPVSDDFGASVLIVTTALMRMDSALARRYTRQCAQWVLDRHDPEHAGLGLAGISEDARTATERLIGGSLTFTQVDRRTSSYLATVLLDLAVACQDAELLEAMRQNFDALEVVPCATRAEDKRAFWKRGGTAVIPVPRVHISRAIFSPEDEQLPVLDKLALLLVTRSRHSRRSLEEALPAV
jgi:hypothetical protein